jgi:hypothetical protein
MTATVFGAVVRILLLVTVVAQHLSAARRLRIEPLSDEQLKAMPFKFPGPVRVYAR